VFVPGLMMVPPLLRGAPLGGIGEDERGLLYCKSFGIVRKRGKSLQRGLRIYYVPYLTVPYPYLACSWFPLWPPGVPSRTSPAKQDAA
jgi:hypothetical protein